MHVALLLYATLFLTVIWQEEAAPLAGALAAHHGHGEFWLVVAACTLGTWTGDVVLYAGGRWGHRFVGRSRFARALALVRRHPRAAPLAVRFAYGLRLSLPVACGAAALPFPTYVLWAGLSATLWSTAFAALGWLAGETSLHLFGAAAHYEWPAIGAVLLLMLVAWLVILRRRMHDLDAPQGAVRDA